MGTGRTGIKDGRDPTGWAQCVGVQPQRCMLVNLSMQIDQPRDDVLPTSINDVPD